MSSHFPGLRLEMRPTVELQQKQTLSTALLTRLEQLALPVAALSEIIQAELLENPALSLSEPDGDIAVEEDDEQTPDVSPELASDEWRDLSVRRARNTDDRDPKHEALKSAPARGPSAHDSLVRQLMDIEAPRELKELAEHIIHSLNDRGFLAPHRYAEAMLKVMSRDGAINKTISEIIASVDGVDSVRVPEATERGVSPEQIEQAKSQRDELMIEALGVSRTLSSLLTDPARSESGKGEILLLQPLAEIVALRPGEWSLEDAENALLIVQSLSPRGIAARTLRECLVLQLNPGNLLYPEQRELLSNHLDELLKNKWPTIAKAMGLDLDELKIVIESLRGLNYAPGLKLHQEAARQVRPGVSVYERDGQFIVDVVYSQLPAIEIDSEYLAQSEEGLSAGQKKQRKRYIQKAQELVMSVAQRHHTLSRVTHCIFLHQADFLLQGEAGLKPLKMEEIADDLSLHISTISRAVANEYVDTPYGIFPLKHFFRGGMRTQSGEVVVRTEWHQHLRELVAGEDKQNPLSDDQLSQELTDRGFKVQRRTVAKHRRILGIPSSRKRREWV